MPEETVKRYIKQKTISSICIWRFSNQCKSISANKILRIEVMYEAEVRWSKDNWQSSNTTQPKQTGIGIFYADINVNDAPAQQIVFTFFWVKENKWEEKNFAVEITPVI